MSTTEKQTATLSVLVKHKQTKATALNQLLFSVHSAVVEDVVDAVRSLAHCDTYGFNCSNLHDKFVSHK